MEKKSQRLIILQSVKSYKINIEMIINNMENKKPRRDLDRIYSVDIADSMRIVMAERDSLKQRLNEALHLIEFHKYLIGEDFVRNKIIKILKG